MIAPEASPAFVANMEGVLEVYHSRTIPSAPLVCLDETSKQLIVETRAPIAATPDTRSVTTTNTSAMAWPICS